MFKRFLAAMIAASALFAVADDALPYNESADAKVEIQHALQLAAKEKQTVLVVFGANWCGDCRALDKTLKGEQNASLVSRHFRIVKVNVGRYDKNLDLAALYGVPLKKGIPTVAMLSPRSDVIYATKAGELADARHMSDGDIYAFFDNLVKTHPVE